MIDLLRNGAHQETSMHTLGLKGKKLKKRYFVARYRARVEIQLQTVRSIFVTETIFVSLPEPDLCQRHILLD